METNIETPASKTVKTIFQFLKVVLEEEAEYVKTAYEKFIAHSTNPSDFTWESIGEFFIYLHDKFPSKEEEITNFRRLINRAERTRKAGFFFTKDNYFTIKGIIENFKNYFNFFTGWDDKVCTYTEESRGIDRYSFKFVTRVFNTNFCDYLTKCTIEFDEESFFKHKKKALLLALTRSDNFGIRASVKKERREKVLEKLLSMLPEDFFEIEDLLIKDVEESTAEPCVKKLSIGELMANEIADIFKQHNFIFTWDEDITESKEKMSKFLAIVNSFLYDTNVDDGVLSDIMIVLRKGKDIYAKNGWQIFVENNRIFIIDTDGICSNLYNAALLFMRYLSKDFDVTLKHTEELFEFTVEHTVFSDDEGGRASFTVVKNNITTNYNKLREKFFKAFFWVVPQNATANFVEEFNKKTRC